MRPCKFAEKVWNAQLAGAVGVRPYQLPPIDTVLKHDQRMLLSLDGARSCSCVWLQSPGGLLRPSA